MGPEDRGVSILFTILLALARRFLVLNEIATPTAPLGTTRMITFWLASQPLGLVQSVVMFDRQLITPAVELLQRLIRKMQALYRVFEE